MITKVTLALVACWFVAVHAVDLDATCASNTDCTVANSECSKLYDGCTNGECKCKTGYQASGTTKCLAEVTNGQACDGDSTNVCIGGTTCASGTCACASTHEYNTLLQICVTIGQKAISEECADVSKCQAGNTVAECVANTGTQTPLYCRCVTGYITEANSCRQPYVGETCDAVVGCAKQVDFSSLFTVFNQEDETCVSGTCTCPSTADQLSATYQGVSFKFCQTKFTGTEKAKGDTCTASNECSSNFCKQCPGDSTSTCISTTTISESTASRSVAVSGAALFLSCATYWFL